MEIKKAIFIISLDFELYWGLRDKNKLESIESYLDSALTQIPKLLVLLDKYDVRVTCAVVGKLLLPTLDDYDFHMRDKERFFLAKELVQDFQRRGHEIASHTYNHIYHLDNNLSLEHIKEDISSFKSISNNLDNTDIQSVIFPRNQYNKEILDLYSDMGYTIYRGNPHNRFLKGKPEKKLNLVHRAYRFLDSYVNLSGNNITKIVDTDANLINIPASHFYRTFNKKLRYFESLKTRRILKSIDALVDQKGIYHLWWHPHNLGTDLNKNLESLERLFNHVCEYREAGLIEISTMRDVYDSINNR